MKHFVILLAAAVSACAGARGALTPNPETLVTSSEVRRQLFALADDSMMGRATASEGERRAARFIAAEMAAIGVEAGGDSGYFQRIPVALRSVEVMGRDSVRISRQVFARLASFADLDTIPAERRRVAYNVVGIIRGTDAQARDSAVVIGAHFDHVGMRANATGDSIYNGADDDASGVVTVLQAAKALKHASPQPRRTLVFALFTGEEMGGVGSRHYIANPVIPMDRTIAQMQVEMIGRPDSLAGGFGKAWLTGYERSTMGDMLAASGIPLVADPRPCQGFFQRSDNIAFARIGIPAHTLSSFNLHSDYHQPSDEPGTVDIEHMTTVIRHAVRAVQLLSAGAAPTWKEGMRPPAQGRISLPSACAR